MAATVSTDTTDSKDKAPSIQQRFNNASKRKDVVEREKRSVARAHQARVNQTKQRINRELSCVPAGARTRRDRENETPKEIDEGQQKMLDHLKSIAPFHGRWEINKIINSGTYGVVLSVTDNKTQASGVIKIAKAGSESWCNIAAEWEAFILEKIFKANPDASVCRLLDHGMLQGFEGQGLEFMCLEFAGENLHEHLKEYSENDRKLRCCQLSLMTLKGVYDLHKEGLLHRDLKIDNMGLISREQPIVLLFDLGLARMYTDAEGKTRCFRSTVGFRGTMEWASGNALKGREQTRYDDLIAWFYCMIDLFHGNKDSNQVFPWSCRPRGGKEVQLFKSMFAPAKFLLRNCPKSFFPINTYLQTAPRHSTPDYAYIADRIKDAMEELVPGSTNNMEDMTKPLVPEKSSLKNDKPQ